VNAAPDPLDDVYTRESMRIRAAQSLRTLPVVALSLVGVYFALRGRVELSSLGAWSALMAVAALLRALACQAIRRRVDVATPAQLRGFERVLWATAIFNTFAVGSSFWLIAANGDVTVRVVMTLLSCFYAIGALVNASSHFASFAVGTVLNLGQGSAFWLGAGGANPPQPEVALPFIAVMLLMIGFGREYSRQFRESLQIRTQNLELLNKVEADKSLIESALLEAQRASDSKSRFLAAASHDLRQPLHALTMFLTTLTFHVSTSEGRRLLGRAKDTAGVLEEQFDSLLDLSRFEVGAIEADPQPFRIDKVIEELLDAIQVDAELKHLIVRRQVQPAVVRGDPTLVARLLRNLLDNAVKYTSEGSVGVEMHAIEEGWRIDVVDTGPGIAREHHSRIFEEYVQLDNPGRQRRLGVGLGLAIVRRIDNLLGLKLELQSERGQGARFSIQLPAGRLDEAQSGDFQFDAVLSFRTSHRIWIVDDDPGSREALEGQLVAWGARVATYDDPERVLRDYGVVASRPDWLICDDMLGDTLSGLTVADRLRAEFGHENCCILTGNTDPVRLEELRASGFPLLLKPAQPEALIALLHVA
jgi:signal transduction histidine kinase/CheY-like chemotaxis protein